MAVLNNLHYLGQGSTAASNTWCIIHGILMHTVTTHFISIVLVSVSGSGHHKRVGNGLIDVTGLAASASAQSSIEITPFRNKFFSTDEAALLLKMQNILQFFLELLQLAGGDLHISK
jgi:hypothetical protein